MKEEEIVFNTDAESAADVVIRRLIETFWCEWRQQTEPRDWTWEAKQLVAMQAVHGLQNVCLISQQDHLVAQGSAAPGMQNSGLEY